MNGACCRPPAGRLRDHRGYTIIEMVVAMGIMTVVSGAIFQMAGSTQSGFRTQPEVIDMQQRLRVAADMIYKDLLMAGAGPSFTTDGSLANYFPPIAPARRGLQTPDAELSQAQDRISIVYAARSRAQTMLSADQGSSSSALPLDTLNPSCPATAPCGFTTGMRALVFDASGLGNGFDIFNVSGTSPNSIFHAAPNPSFSKAYTRDSARVIEVEQHVYSHDAANRRLMHYDGHQGEFPLVDDVVGLRFTYYADPDPSSAPQPATGQANCVYDAGTPPVPKLADLGSTALKPLTAAQLTDGPTCGLSPNRFDGDLLRVRKIRVTIRVQVGLSDLRGSGGDFNQAGASSSGTRYIPDYSMSFEVTPRNLNLIR